MSSSIEGGCLCRAVRYQALGEPLAKTLCHCRTCRLASGAPSVAWVVFRASEFRFSAGSPARFQSSPDVIRTFCSKCGTPLTYQQRSKTDTVDVTTVTLDSPESFAPTKEIWIEHRLSWESLNVDMAHYAKSSTGASPIDT